MKNIFKLLTIVSALIVAVVFTTCKQFLDDPEEVFSYWSAEVVPTGYDINIAKPYKTDNDGVICVPSSNSLSTDDYVTVTIYLRNPKKFSLVMPTADKGEIISFPLFPADKQYPKYSTDNDYTLEQTPDKQALKLTYKSSFLKKHECGTADIGPEITLKSTDGRPFSKKFSLNLKVNTSPSLDYKGVGKKREGIKWYHVLIFQAKNMGDATTPGHYVHEDIEKLHIVKQGEPAAHYTVSNIDFLNKKINWTDSSKFLSGATQLDAVDCEGNPPVLPTGDWLIYFKTDVEVSPSSALKTYEAWLSDKAGILSNTVQGSTCTRKIGDIEVRSTPLPSGSGTGSQYLPYKISCDGDGVELEVWCRTPDEDVNILYWIRNADDDVIASGEGKASPTNHLKTIRLSAPAVAGGKIKYIVQFNANKTPGFGSNARLVYYELMRKQGAIIDGNEPDAWAKLKYAIEHENEPEITIKNEIKAQDSSLTIGVQTIKNNEQINVDRNVKIKGFDANAVINADSKCRIFNVASGKELELNRLTLKKGKANMDQYGVDKYGGAIYAQGATIKITNSTLTGNTAQHGGAIYAKKTSGTVSTVTIKDGTIGGEDKDANQVRGGSGGGIYVGKDCELTLEGSVQITGNKATKSGIFGGLGSGVYVQNASAKFTMKGSAKVNTNNDVYLAADGGGDRDLAKITVDSSFSLSSGEAALITPRFYENTLNQPVQVLDGSGVSANYKKFKVTPEKIGSIEKKWRVAFTGFLTSSQP